jgi:hypothetical protein
MTKKAMNKTTKIKLFWRISGNKVGKTGEGLTRRKPEVSTLKWRSEVK